MNVLCDFGIGLSIVLLFCGIFGIAITMADDNFVFMVLPETTQESSIVETIETTLH